MKLFRKINKKMTYKFLNKTLKILDSLCNHYQIK
jgi:hypothetical protein